MNPLQLRIKRYLCNLVLSRVLGQRKTAKCAQSTKTAKCARCTQSAVCSVYTNGKVCSVHKNSKLCSVNANGKKLVKTAILFHSLFLSCLLDWCLQFRCSPLWNVHSDIPRLSKPWTSNRSDDRPGIARPRPPMCAVWSHWKTRYDRDCQYTGRVQ